MLAVDARSRFLRLALGLATVCTGPACSCASGSLTGENPREKGRQVEVAAPQSATHATATTPQAPVVVPVVCPEGLPVKCPDLCCPAGTTCGNPGCAAPSGQGACASSTPVPCDEPASCAAGCAALDASSQANTLQITPPSGFGTGRFAAGLHLAPGNPCTPTAIASSSGFPTGDAPITVELWLRTTVTSTTQTVFSYGGTSYGSWRALQVMADGVLRWDLGGISSCSSSAVAANDGAWHFVAATYGASKAALYLDGTKVADCTVGPLATTAGQSVTLGANPPGAPSCTSYDGDIDEVRVLDHAADDAQVAADLSAAPFQAAPGTVALWHFDEGVTHRCCPVKAACSPGGACLSSQGASKCPPSAPVDCKDGTCCPEGKTCTAGGCVVPAPHRIACPAEAPLACDDGTCCFPGLACDGKGGCTAQPATSPSTQPICTGGTLDIVSQGVHGCCPPPGDGTWNIDTWTSDTGAYLCEAILAGTQFCVTCPDGYTCDTPYSGFCKGTGSVMACPDSREACGVWLGQGGTDTPGCCPAGTACSFGSWCCPPGTNYVGGACDACCPLYSTCGAGGACLATGEAGSCEAGEVPCGANCCPAGATCGTGGACVWGAPVPAVCTVGFVCANLCCALGQICMPGLGCLAAASLPACPAQTPVVCADGVTCCAAGSVCGPSGTCAGTGDDFLPPDVTPGSQKCGDGWCDRGKELPVCIDGHCCPTEATLCGEKCCPSEHGCSSDGTDCGCDCLGNQCFECGDECCQPDDVCTSDGCRLPCADPAFPVDCGRTACCPPGSECVDGDGDCGCGGDFPVACADYCCAEGVVCDKAGNCVCPSGTQECGDYCCGTGTTCQGGRCVKPSSGGGSCPTVTYASCCGSDGTATLMCEISTQCSCPSPAREAGAASPTTHHCSCR